MKVKHLLSFFAIVILEGLLALFELLTMHFAAGRGQYL